MRTALVRIAQATLGFLSCLGVAACSQSSPVVDSVPMPPKDPASERIAPPSDTELEPPSASAAAPAASASAEPVERDRPPRVGAVTSTRGKIACGTSSCEAEREVCGFDESKFAWACEADTPGAKGPYACDDGTDCPEGKTCCHPWESRWVEVTYCVARKDVAAVCNTELCVEGGDGARCPAGQTCEGDVCEAPDGPATCSGKKRCPKTAPFCVKTAAGYECAAAGSSAYNAASGNDRYQCTRQSDCGAGESCFAVVGDSEPEYATACGRYDAAFLGPLVCEVGTRGCPRPGNCDKDMACFPYALKELPWTGAWSRKMH